MADFYWPPAPPVLEQDVRFGYLDRRLSASKQFNPEIVFNSEGSTMLRTLRQNLRTCTSFTFSVAFVSPRAIALLKQELAEFSGKGRIITSDYLGFNSPHAFSELLNLAQPNALSQASIDVRLHRRTDFHPKGYIFHHTENVTAVLGSSNLTENALVRNHEWNLKVAAGHDSDLASQIEGLLDSELHQSDALTAEWIEEYRKHYVRPPARSGGGRRRGLTPRIAPQEAASEGLPEVIEPNAMQRTALEAIQAMRMDGKDKALVISATGTGKTILSALDVRQVNPRRMLFVVHREQILDKAMCEFQRVLNVDDEALSKLAGSSKQFDAKYTFATVQTLSQPDVLSQFDPDEFDYILIDEVHRAGAESYRRVLDHFRPNFLLGITATPERTDGTNVYELFDFNVPYEIRLNHALEEGMLSPFHYYGVADIEPVGDTSSNNFAQLARLTSDERVEHILSAISLYGQAGIEPRGLIFCSRKDEAARLSELLNERSLRGRRLRTVALTGDDPIARREEQVKLLEAGEIDYILTVDIFNEGVDIPSINQVIMLRQTQSAIVFVQQLGRGLRKHDDKEYVVVIDFIGNYANNYLIPIALFGDESLNKESLRQNLIAAEESGVLPGLSSIRFDQISQERVLQSIVDTKLDKMQNLKAAFESMQNRLGGTPRLMDFYRFESVDPVLMATKEENYPRLVAKIVKEPSGLTEVQDRLLTLLSNEVLPAKRLHETMLLEELLQTGRLELADIRRLFEVAGIASGSAHVDSAIRTLTLEFNVEGERDKYRYPAAVRVDDGIELSSELAGNYQSSEDFAVEVDDLLATGKTLITDKYSEGDPFVVGKQYSRKDACRLLNWQKNQMGNVFGYKVDIPTKSCPIFVTYQKADDVTASTDYGDELIDPSTMHWFTRSRRTLKSAELAPILANEVDLHVFVKKDDNHGTDFFYLGRAKSWDARDAHMAGAEGLPVVRMNLNFMNPVPTGFFAYFSQKFDH
ncbi:MULTISPECIES: DEAD/DEAH box helicase [Arthrobacter]|uniref:DEAD/DEAH box helicase n=2 Tax=Arthrobacter TaxID=1663 RepID=A0ABU9KLK1_9MICC|nr:DEAD/DEAH box helicase [Arthrobacter sp. YJM1]MDP5226705.1 DEAD/DEAH box helicase [Arthrobacter sp. YJM1]